MSIGGSKSKGSTTSTSASESEDWGTAVWGQQAPYLQDLYKRSNANLGNNQQGLFNSYIGAANAADSSSSSALARQQQMLKGGLSGIGASNTNLNAAAAQLGLTGSALTQASSALGGGKNALSQGYAALGQSNRALQQFLKPGVDPALAAYSKALGQQFNEQFLTGLQGDAAVAGGLGGSRQQIGAALGSQRAQQSLSEFAAQSYAGQQERALSAAQSIGALNQGYAQNAAGWQGQASGYGDIAGARQATAQGYQNNAAGYLNNSNAYSNLGAGFAQNAAGFQGLSQNQQAKYDLARSMPWYNLNQYAGLLGLPVQNDLGGWTSSKTTSKGKSGSGGFNFGLGGG